MTTHEQLLRELLVERFAPVHQEPQTQPTRLPVEDVEPERPTWTPTVIHGGKRAS